QYASKATPQDLESLPRPQVPELVHSSVRISLSRSSTSSSSSASAGGAGGSGSGASDDVWEAMEKDLVEGGWFSNGGTSGVGGKGGRSMFALSSNRDVNSVTCAIGEPVFVHMELYNPMQVPITINDVCVRYTHKPAGAKKDTAPGPATDGSGEAVTVDKMAEITLDGLQRRKVQITMRPKQEGQIDITGLTYKFCNIVPNFQPFHPRKSSTTTSPHPLRLVVTPPMPVLDVTFHGFPETMLSGEVVQTILEINNRGRRGLTGLVVKMSHPAFFGFGGPDELEKAAYVEKPELSQQYSVDNTIFDSSVCRIKLPLSNGVATGKKPEEEHESTSDAYSSSSKKKGGDRVLAPGMATIIPVWIRGDRMGRHVFRFLFGYQSEDEVNKVSFRTLKHTLTTSVQPSLRINAFTRPSARILNEFVLGIEVENLQANMPIRIKQVSSFSPSWTVHFIGDKSDTLGIHLEGKQTSYLYFRFTSRAEGGKESVKKKLANAAASGMGDVASEIAVVRAVENLIMGDEAANAGKQPPVELKISNLAMYPGFPAQMLKNIFTLYYTDDVDLALVWEAAPGSGTPTTTGIPASTSLSSISSLASGTAAAGVSGGPKRCGHHYIMGINLGLQSPLQLQTRFGKNVNALQNRIASKALYAQTIREKKAVINSLLKSRQKEMSPIRLVLRAPNEVQHAFGSKDSKCIVPVTVVINNGSWMNVASYALELQSEDGSGLQWLGHANRQGTLHPEEEESFVVDVWFPEPGVYDLNRWKLNVSLDFAPGFGPTSVSSPNATDSSNTSAAAPAAGPAQGSSGAGGGGGGGGGKGSEKGRANTQKAPPAATTFIQMPNLTHLITVKKVGAVVEGVLI
ncbi:Trafficking protein particle complex 8, partial [Quaeritorhiza haematococci]